MKIAKLYSQMSSWPLGKWIFSKIAAQKAPYFSSINPYISELTQTTCIVDLKKSRSVQNHLGTVHAIAMCNACELAFGLTMEAGIPSHLRWIPKAMTVRYLKKAETSLNAACDYPQILTITPGDHIVPVKVRDINQQIVMEADITVYISEKRK
ncbi:MAG: hotdog fold domain-containing protein [Pseudobdellovibrio sp.]